MVPTCWDFVEDQLIPLVEKEDAKLLLVGKSHCGPAVVDDAGPGRQHRPFLHLASGQPALRSVHDLELGDDSLADAFGLRWAAGAEITSGNDPDLAMRSLASGFTSR